MINFLLNLKSFIPLKIRVILHKIYFNPLICYLENLVCGNKIKYSDLVLVDDKNIISNITRSLIRHNLYEKYEFEAVENLFLEPENLIDLGSSIGLLSLSIARKQENKKIVLVEPVFEYQAFSKKLFKKYSKNEHYFVNKAIDYSDNKIFIEKKDILESEVNYLSGKNIDKVTINEIIKSFKIDRFNLIIDIEGLSFEPLFKESNIFSKCTNLLIEEKFSEEYKKEIVFEKLKDLGFEVFYFQETRGSNVIAAYNKEFHKKNL